MAAAACAALARADATAAPGVRAPFPVAVRARLEVSVLATDASGRWVATSRSPADPSRFMADLTAGNDAWGTLYLKGVSSWRDADDALGRVDFRLDQGDYFRRFTTGDSAVVEVRAFGDERRFFTHEYGTALVEDDEVARFQHRLGARVDAAAGPARGTYWIASFDEGRGDHRIDQYLAARAAARFAFAALGYRHDDPARGDDHAIVKGEAGGYYRRLTAIVSYEQSGFGNGAFLPSGSWDDLDGGYAQAAPENAATFAELRARRLRAGENHLIDAAWRYGAVGRRYTNDLSARVPGTVRHDAWINWAHRQYAIDTRLDLADEVASGALHAERRALRVTSRARLKNNAELLLRGGADREESGGAEAEHSGFVHAAFARELQGFLGGAHLLVDRLGDDATLIAGAEARVNWNATSAVYARWIVSDAVTGGDAIYVRLEFRPTRRTWVTLAYGRPETGDDAYFVEDRDARPGAESGDRVLLTVRGDL